MKLKQLLEQLNQLAKERPEALEMEVITLSDWGYHKLTLIEEKENVDIYKNFGDLEIINKAILIG